jgi:membrane-associated phospholipid phosphatase
MAMDYRRAAPQTLPLPRAAAVARIGFPILYAAAAVVVFVFRGVPLERGLLSVWILGGLLVLSLGNLRSFGRSLLLEWVPLLGALTLYDVVRGLGGGRFPIHGGFQVSLDRLFGLGSVPTVWLQEHLWTPGRVRSIDLVSWAVYMSYFLLTPLVLGTLWILDRERFRSYARRLTLLSFVSVAGFCVWPSMPPWLASSKGMIGPANRLIGDIGGSFAWFDANPLWERGLHLANDLAAFPSLHEGMTVLVAIMLWRSVPRVLRPLLAAYPLVMAFALVYTGEHYVIDLVAGALLAIGICWLEPRLTARLVRRWRRVRAASA